MNLVFHHLRKDTRLLRWWILLWLLVVGAMALPDLLIFQPDFDAARAVDSYRSSPLSILLGIIAWTVLVARLIQSEPVTGSSSFWLTRSVPKRVYLMSKFIFLAVIVMLPSLLPGIVHAFVFGVDGVGFGSGIVSVLATQLLAVICVIWLATYTPNLVYFAGMLCLGAVVVVVEGILISAQRHSYGNGDQGFMVLVVAGLLVASLFVEHLRRGSRLGFYIGMAAISFGIVYQYFAPSAGKMIYSSTVFPTLRDAKVDFQPDWRKTVTWSQSSYGNGQTVPAAFSNLIPIAETAGRRVWVETVEARFDVPGDFSGGLTNIGTSYFSVGSELEANTNLIQAKLPGIKLETQKYQIPANAVLHVGLFNLLDVEDKVRGKTGTLTLNVTGQVLEMRQVAAIPLNDPHYIAHLPGGFLRVGPIAAAQSTHLLTLWSVGPTDFPNSSQGDCMCVLVDPQAGTGKMLKFSMSNSFTVAGMGPFSDSVFHYAIDGSEPLERMVLYVFKYVPTEQFQTKLVAPDFTMSPTTK